MNNRFLTLDILRGISAIMIVLYHYTVRYNENPLTEGCKVDWSFQCSFGFAAVTTFFLMSGYFSGKLITKKLKPTSTLIKRLNRLLPTFWTCATISALVMFLIWDKASVSLLDYLGNLTMIPGLLRTKAIDGAYWTLQLELFWAIWLAAMMIIKKIKYRYIILLMWIISSIILSFFNNVQDPLLSGCRMVLMIPFAPTFIGGACIWIIQNENYDRSSYNILVSTFILCLACQLLQDQTVFHNLFYYVTIILILFHKKLDKYLSADNIVIKFIVWIASISYPLYLLHQMIGFAIISNLKKVGFESDFIIFVPIIFIITISYMVHHCIEINKKVSLIRA